MAATRSISEWSPATAAPSNRTITGSSSSSPAVAVPPLGSTAAIPLNRPTAASLSSSSSAVIASAPRRNAVASSSTLADPAPRSTTPRPTAASSSSVGTYVLVNGKRLISEAALIAQHKPRPPPPVPVPSPGFLTSTPPSVHSTPPPGIVSPNDTYSIPSSRNSST